MKPPLINVEETIDKTVGRRRRAPEPLLVETSNKAEAIAWRQAFGGIRVPRGIHRFRTHAEADEWLWKMITRRTRTG
jgi:hypothetical protein